MVATAVLGIGLCLLGTSPRPIEPASAPWVAQTSALSDTLEATVVVGETLIRTLPDAPNGSPVASYRMLRGPALSGVAGRSLTWITRSVTPDTYELHLQARRPDASPDTLVVRVDVQPS